jgi:hypothetical protein
MLSQELDSASGRHARMKKKYTRKTQGGPPPGKIEVFDPASSTWSAAYRLPAGFVQPLFPQFDVVPGPGAWRQG